VRRRLLLLATLASFALPAEQARAAGSADVAALQVALRAHGLYSGDVDGGAGPGTRAAVRAFQARAGLDVDGVAGPATRRALGRRGRPSLGTRALAAGASGWDVAALQFLLAMHGFPSGPIDGGFGERTAAALARYQRFAGLGADGVAGPATVARLHGARPQSVLRFLSPVGIAPGDGFRPRGASMHTGLDYPAAYGAAVRAAGRGCVSTITYEPGGYGTLVVLRHRLGMTSWYAHLSSVAVGRGACVTAGQLIGRVGSSGRSSGPHLHFELRLRGAAVDPRSGL
jgi:peptidoglycan hydrolase-like protein with peptidoglycan-binding domain